MNCYITVEFKIVVIEGFGIVDWSPTPSEVDLNLKNELGDVFQD